MRKFLIIILLIFDTCYAQISDTKIKFVADKKIQSFTFDFGFGNVNKFSSAYRLGLNVRTKNNWNYNLDYDDFISDDLYPFIDQSYLINDISIRFGKLYRKGIWLYGAGIGPSYFLKNTVLDANNFLSPKVLHETTIGLSPKINIILAPLPWFGIGVSYNYNLNTIQSTNMLWFSIYTGRLRFKLKKYKSNYNNL